VSSASPKNRNLSKAKTAKEVAEAGIAAGCEFDRNSAAPCDFFTLKATKDSK